MAVLDLEMTGLKPETDRVCEVAVVREEGGKIQEFSSLIRPEVPISKGARRVHGLTTETLKDAPLFGEVAERVRELLEGAVVIAHNVPFDLDFLHREFDRTGRPLAPPVTVDTLLMARRLFAFRKNNLGAVCERLDVPMETAHRALADARATHGVWRRMVEILDPESTVTVGEIVRLVGALAPNSPLRLHQQRVLRSAYHHRRTVWIEYQSAGSLDLRALRREIGIWFLKLPYIQAWCYLREGERVFRLDRIRAVEGGQKPYEVPEFQRRI